MIRNWLLRGTGHRFLWSVLQGLRPAEGFPQKPGTSAEYPARGRFFDPATAQKAGDKRRSPAPRLLPALLAALLCAALRRRFGSKTS